MMGRQSVTEGLALSSAAWSEAARVRAAELDVEHVLAGIAAGGGEGARILGQAGVTLAGLRAATRRVRDRHLAEVGVDASVLPQPAPRDLADLHRDAAGDIPMSERFRALTTGAAAGSGVRLLGAVIDEPSGRGREILTETGADVEVLRRVVGATADAPPGWRIVAPRRDLLGDGPASKAVQIRRFVSASPDVVARVAARPSFGEARLGRTEKNGYRFWPELVEDRVEGSVHRVVWVTRVARRGLEAETNYYAEMEITPAPGGAEVTSTRAHRIRGGLRGRVVAGLSSVPLLRVGAWKDALDLALLCADEGP